MNLIGNAERFILLNKFADAISEDQYCGSCAGCSPETRHCKACETEAEIAIKAIENFRRQELNN